MAKRSNRNRGTVVMRDLQAQHALQAEYELWTHGNRYAQETRRMIPGDAAIEAAFNGGKQVDDSGRISSGFNPRDLCPCGIARSKNGAANCGEEH